MFSRKCSVTKSDSQIMGEPRTEAEGTHHRASQSTLANADQAMDTLARVYALILASPLETDATRTSGAVADLIQSDTLTDEHRDGDIGIATLTTE